MHCSPQIKERDLISTINVCIVFFFNIDVAVLKAQALIFDIKSILLQCVTKIVDKQYTQIQNGFNGVCISTGLGTSPSARLSWNSTFDILLFVCVCILECVLNVSICVEPFVYLPVHSIVLCLFVPFIITTAVFSFIHYMFILSFIHPFSHSFIHSNISHSFIQLVLYFFYLDIHLYHPSIY